MLYKQFMDRAELAKKVGYKSRQQVDYLVTGRRNASYDKAKKIAKVLNTDAEMWLDSSRSSERKKAVDHS